jgi:hypothetical protein
MKSDQSNINRLSTYIGVTLAAVIVISIVHISFAPAGYFAVRAACAAEGGLRIVERPVGDGYLHTGFEWAEGVLENDCRECGEQVATRQFSYVDFQRPPPQRGKSSALVRYRLEADSHPNCVAGASFTKPPPGTCVAVEPVNATSHDKYSYRSELITNVSRFGVAIKERRRTLTEISTGRAVAIDRYFSYATPFEKYGKFEPSYHCEWKLGHPAVEGNFFDAVFGGHADGKRKNEGDAL